MKRSERPNYDIFEENGAYYLQSTALDLKIATDRTFYKRWKIGERATKQHVKHDKLERGLGGGDKIIVLHTAYERAMQKLDAEELHKDPEYDEDDDDKEREEAEAVTP